MNRILIFFIALLLGGASLGWIDPLADKIRQGNQLYNNGKYDDALDKYVDAQVSSSGMPQLNFNMADAQYKRGKYGDATQLFQKAMKSDNIELKAKSSFNMGNTMYKQGKMKEALEYYKKTVDFVDQAESSENRNFDMLKNDAKYNYEYVGKKMKENEQKQRSQNQKDQQQEKKRDKDDKQSDGNKGENKERQEPQKDKQSPGQENTPKKSEDKKDTTSPYEKDNQKEQPMEQQQPQPQGQKQMSKEEAHRLLEALNQSEKETRTIMKDTQKLQHNSVEKDW